MDGWMNGLNICVFRAVGLTPGPYLIGLCTEAYNVCMQGSRVSTHTVQQSGHG